MVIVDDGLIPPSRGILQHLAERREGAHSRVGGGGGVPGGSCETAASGGEALRAKFDCSGFEREGGEAIYREATEVARDVKRGQWRVDAE